MERFLALHSLLAHAYPPLPVQQSLPPSEHLASAAYSSSPEVEKSALDSTALDLHRLAKVVRALHGTAHT